MKNSVILRSDTNIETRREEYLLVLGAGDIEGDPDDAKLIFIFNSDFLR